MRILEEALCTGGDAACRLWVVKPQRNGIEAGTSMNGRSSSTEGNTPISKDARDFLTKSAEQRHRNEKYCEKNALMIHESIKRLSAALGTLFESYSRHLPEKARAGRLVARNAYRLSVVHDPYVFLRDGDETENNLRVTLLLDASMSRLYSQEKIAAEAYVIASSLERIHIPLEILSYRTIRGFTVIEKLKESVEKNPESVLGYTAGGWNRDSLAFRTVGRMIREEDPNRKQSHILLILTDASPNDSMPIASGGLLGGKEYEGELSVREARKAVSALREDGIRTSAIFLGSSAHLDNVHQIFGKEYVRIQTIAQLADGVSELIAMMLRESPPD
jgi:nitric oxide reductase activation protein